MRKETENTVSAYAEQSGIKIDTLQKRWKAAFPGVPFSRYAELSEAELSAIARKTTRKGAENSANAYNIGTEKTDSAEKQIPQPSEVVPQAAESSFPVVAEIPQGFPLEIPSGGKTESSTENAESFDFRLFLIRCGLWAISAGQVALLIYGTDARFGQVGFWVGVIAGVFLFVVNLTATDARFWGASDTGFWVAVLLSCVFGALHYYTFIDYLQLDGSLSERKWFALISASVIEVLGLAAMSLQAKISIEK